VSNEKLKLRWKKFLKQQRDNGNASKVENFLTKSSAAFQELDKLAIQAVQIHPYVQATKLGVHVANKAFDLAYNSKRIGIKDPDSGDLLSKSYLNDELGPNLSSGSYDWEMVWQGLTIEYVNSLQQLGSYVNIPYYALGEHLVIGVVQKAFFLFGRGTHSKVLYPHERSVNGLLREHFTPLSGLSLGIHTLDVEEKSLEAREIGLFISYLPRQEDTDNKEVKVCTYPEEAELAASFIEKKVCYKALLIGPPGSGKTTVAKDITAQYGNRIVVTLEYLNLLPELIGIWQSCTMLIAC